MKSAKLSRGGGDGGDGGGGWWWWWCGGCGARAPVATSIPGRRWGPALRFPFSGASMVGGGGGGGGGIVVVVVVVEALRTHSCNQAAAHSHDGLLEAYHQVLWTASPWVMGAKEHDMQLVGCPTSTKCT